MCLVKRILGFSVCVIIMAAFSGCVPPAASIHTGNGPVESLRPGFDVVYRPQIQPGETWNTVLTAFQRTFRGVTWAYLGEDYLTYNRARVVENFAFHNNRVEILHRLADRTDSRTFALFYYQLLNLDIAVESSRDSRRGLYAVIFPEIVTFRSTDLSTAQRFADALFFWKQQVQKVAQQQNEELARFEPVAAQYRALAIKPPVSEEQRRLVVQANVLTQQKQYGKAILQYRKVIELDRTAYPEAYFNLALLAAQENLPISAISYMRHYLLLKPDAKDARGAQDKIYEWELMMQR